MTRLRANLAYGTITDNPLLVGATTLNSAELPRLAAVSSPDIYAVTLDPHREHGEPEIIHVTSYDGSATSATILRGQEGTTAREHPAGTRWDHAATVLDMAAALVDAREYASINAAVDDAPDGSTILIAADTWDQSAGSVEVDGRTGLTFLGVGYGSILTGAVTQPIFDVSNSSDITLRNLRLVGDDTAGTIVKTGIKAQGAVLGLNVDRCFIHDMGYDAVHVLNGTLSRRMRVTNCTIWNCDGDAVNPGGGGTGDSVDGFVVANNTIRDIVGDGVHLSIGSQYGTVVGNLIESCSANAVGLNNCAHVTITSNTIRDCTVALGTFSSTPHEDISFTDNVVQGGTRAVDIAHATNRLLVANNRMRGQSAASAIRVANLTDGTIRDNELPDSTIEEGSGCTSLVVEGNRVASFPTVESGTVSRGNIVTGLPTESAGTGTILDTDTEASVSHGLAGTPTSVIVTPRGNGPLWVPSRTGSAFVVERAGSSGDLAFDWQAAKAALALPGHTAPPVTANLAVDLDVLSFTTLADTDPVETWPDESGNSRDASQGTAGKRPLYRLEVTPSGLPAVRFDGTDDRMVTGAFSLSQPNTVFIVGKGAGVSASSRPFIDGIASTARHYIGFNGTTEWLMNAGGSSLTASGQDGNYHVFRGLFNGASSSLHIDGVSTVTGDPGSHACGGLSIGARWDDSNFLSCDVARILVYDGTLTAGEITDVRGYLTDLYL